MREVIYTYVRFGNRRQVTRETLREAVEQALADEKNEFCSVVSVSDGVTTISGFGLQDYLNQCETQDLFQAALAAETLSEKNEYIKIIAEKFSVSLS